MGSRTTHADGVVVMPAEYEPGTVARVYFHNGGPLPGGEAIALRSGHGWHVVPLTPHHVSCFLADDHRPEVTFGNVRPLVVLDLNAIELPEVIVRHLRGQCGAPAHRNVCPWLSAIADQIEAQTKPLRIPEPGLWGVVEASVGKDGRYQFVRAGDAFWMCTADSSTYLWASLIDPTLIREGLS